MRCDPSMCNAQCTDQIGQMNAIFDVPEMIRILCIALHQANDWWLGETLVVHTSSITTTIAMQLVYITDESIAQLHTHTQFNKMKIKEHIWNNLQLLPILAGTEIIIETVHEDGINNESSQHNRTRANIARPT